MQVISAHAKDTHSNMGTVLLNKQNEVLANLWGKNMNILTLKNTNQYQDRTRQEQIFFDCLNAYIALRETHLLDKYVCV